MWPAEDQWRAPIGDFPPPWASAWGDDPYGLWADLTVNGVIQRMRWIEPSGKPGFLMGSSNKERDTIARYEIRGWASLHEPKPMHVIVSEGFWLADTPCTQAFWQAVTGKNPSHFKKGSKVSECPVESVSWRDVMHEFISCFVRTPEWGTGNQLCLPSERQWEYAARAGASTAYWWGDVWDDEMGNVNTIGERVWYERQGTTYVKSYPPNPWGLYDVHGNVWEWCSSAWQSRQKGAARPNQYGRVARGGSWFSLPDYSRAAFRDWWPLQFADRHLGFRFALKSPASRSL